MKRKPHTLKLLCSTNRPDRDVPDSPALPVLDSPPPAPEWLPEMAAVEFRRLARTLTANRLMTEGCIGLLAQLSCLHARLVEIWSAGATPQASLIAQYRCLAANLNLTAMKPPLAQPQAPNRFAVHLARKS